MTINDVWNWTLFVSNKYQSSAISASEFNTACQVVATELINVKIGLPEQYRPGAPFPNQAYDVTQKITDDLAPFINPNVPIAKNVNGYFPKPADYYAFSSLSYYYIVNSKNCNENPTSTERFIEMVTDGELRIRQGNSIIPPELEYPIARLTLAGFDVYPKQIKNVMLTYLKAPIPPVYGYDVINDEYVYNAATSTQLDFPETLHTEFAMRIVRYFGINIKDEELEKSALIRLQQGQ